MLRTYVLAGLVGLSLLLTTVMTGCDKPSADTPAANNTNQSAPSGEDEAHGHAAGAHGGTIVSLGSDSYHVEAIVSDEGEVRLYTLGNDETRVIDVEAQTLTAYAKEEGTAESMEFEIRPQPQSGDKEGRTSLFAGKLPETLVGKPTEVTVPSITIEGERFRLHFVSANDEHGPGTHDGAAIPEKVGSAAERELYLTPGGIYTDDDIAANGYTVASVKFKGLHAKHDSDPKPGDKVCPISLTKANPEFTWIVDGKPYQFCCPPCVDEFVAMAKQTPDKIKEPSDYVQQ